MKGRRPGSLVRFRCYLCSEVEFVRGGSKKFVCSACRSQGLRAPARRWYVDNGKESASSIVQRALREGVLPHPSSLTCTDCGVVACQYEHRDYNEPLRVDPICRKCNLRRGPARPAFGFFRSRFESGYAPYRRKADMARLLDLLGIPADLSSLPGFVQIEHWAPFKDALLSVDRRPELRTPEAV